MLPYNGPMYIRVWGARGNTPVSGPEYLRYGGDTACVEVVAADGERIILDAGSGLRRLGDSLTALQGEHFNFLLTHAHWDHLQGFPFFRPLYDKRNSLTLYGCALAQDALKAVTGPSKEPPFSPLPYGTVKAVIRSVVPDGKPFFIGSVRVCPVIVSHPNRGFAFRLEEGTHSLVYMPDNNLGFIHLGGREAAFYADFAREADLLIHDAQWDHHERDEHRVWGHSSWSDALDLAETAAVRRLLLFHHSPERTDPEVERIEALAREKAKSVQCEAAFAGMELEI